MEPSKSDPELERTHTRGDLTGKEEESNVWLLGVCVASSFAEKRTVNTQTAEWHTGRGNAGKRQCIQQSSDCQGCRTRLPMGSQAYWAAGVRWAATPPLPLHTAFRTVGGASSSSLPGRCLCAVVNEGVWLDVIGVSGSTGGILTGHHKPAKRHRQKQAEEAEAEVVGAEAAAASGPICQVKLVACCHACRAAPHFSVVVK